MAKATAHCRNCGFPLPKMLGEYPKRCPQCRTRLHATHNFMPGHQPPLPTYSGPPSPAGATPVGQTG